jgi:glutathione synthase/RimK-type ligase-like ATP-grasp enzyme
MRSIIVVNYPHRWAFNIDGVEVVAARDYLTDAAYSDIRRAKVFNLCRSYRYQSVGYYVSLLAEARGHKPTPSVATILDMKSQSVVRIASDELDTLIQGLLAPLQSDRFVLSVYFGKNMAKRYDRLAAKLFNVFHTPFLRAVFTKGKGKGKKWTLQGVSPVAGADVPEVHIPFVVEAATAYFSRRRKQGLPLKRDRYDLALLVDDDEPSPPSNKKALARFVKAAEEVGFAVFPVGKSDYGRLAEYDALFIRATTNVNHYTYRFARKAEAEGLAVIDDPSSILKCANKVFLAELLTAKKIPTPPTMIVHRDNAADVAPRLGFPVILKTPDGSFSKGVVKAANDEQLQAGLVEMWKTSDLVIAQQFTPTPFDWRVGILDGAPLFVCRYYMAKGHWQIIDNANGGKREGNAETLAIADAPPRVIRTAVRAAKLIGDGFYGVDLKEIGKRVYVIEVNDNPNVDIGVEDEVIGDRLYRAVMESFVRRIERKRKGKPS